MGLPINTAEISYIKTKLPSGKSIGIRGWKVKEEKELLFALEMDVNSEDNKTNHIIEMLRKCVDDQAKFDTISENDILSLAIEIRKLSKGDTIDYSTACSGEKCKFIIDDIVNLTKDKVVKPFDVSPLIVNDKTSITFKDLDWKTAEKLYKKYDTASQYTFYHLINSIDSVTENGTTYTEFTPEETEEYIDTLESNDLKALYKGFEDRLSSCTLVRTVKCMKCKSEVSVKFGDLLSFLAL